MTTELDELRLRVDALELRQAAIEARQVRIEHMLMGHETHHQSTNKLLTALASDTQGIKQSVSSLVQAVLQIAAPKPT